MDVTPTDRADGSEKPDVVAAEMPERPWLVHYPSSVPAYVRIPERPLPWLLEEAARLHGANVALEYYGTHISYVQLVALVDRFARGLLRLGLRRGDRVSVCLPNVPQFPIAFYGVLRAGGIVVATNPLYTQPELEHQLNDSGARFVVMLDSVYPTLAAVQARTPVEQVILTSAADYLPAPLALAFRLQQARQKRKSGHAEQIATASAGTLNFKQVLGQSSDRKGFEVFHLPEPASPDEVALLQYTGGTTGVAKGAMLTHRNLLANATQAWAWSDVSHDIPHTSLCVAPFFHVYGLSVGMNLSIVGGARMVLLPRFTVKDVLKAIERYKPDLFPGIPTMYLALAREVEQRPRNLSSIKVCISGSAPLPLEVQKRFEAVSGARVVEGYGLTEASPVTHCNPVFGERRLGTIGLPMPNTDAAIRDEQTGELLSPGQIGEIVVRGPQVMAGYWQRPDETAKVLEHGWLRTGDVGFMSEDGYFTINDRMKDIIIASGYKIFPRDVEEVLYQHPGVLEATVIGVPDIYRGETVRAYIVPKPGQTPTAEELTAFAKERLAAYKVPKQFEFRESLPKTMIGKVLRRELREQYLAEHGQPDS